MSDLLVIFGAGASHDGLRPGGEKPPLAAELFDPKYDDIQRMFTGVDGLRDTILAEMNRGLGLEAILGEFATSQDLNIRRQVFEIPIYLKILLGEFNSSGRAGTYDGLITLIQRRSLSVTFVTLNYDTLLDRAIERKFSSTIESMDDFVRGVEVSGWNYVKLHGSVNWGYPLCEPTIGIRPLDHSRISAYLSELDYQLDDVADVQRDPSRIALLPSDQALSTDDVLMYPALAIPTDKKNETVCPPEHVAVLRSALESDPAILVIGNQGLDSDLMAILGKSSRLGSTRPIHVVDLRDPWRVTPRFAGALGRDDWPRVPIGHPGPLIGESLITSSGVGFREFVEGGRAERFLNEVAAASN